MPYPIFAVHQRAVVLSQFRSGQLHQPKEPRDVRRCSAVEQQEPRSVFWCVCLTACGHPTLLRGKSLHNRRITIRTKHVVDWRCRETFSRRVERRGSDMRIAGRNRSESGTGMARGPLPAAALLRARVRHSRHWRIQDHATARVDVLRSSRTLGTAVLAPRWLLSADLEGQRFHRLNNLTQSYSSSLIPSPAESSESRGEGGERTYPPWARRSWFVSEWRMAKSW